MARWFLFTSIIFKIILAIFIVCSCKNSEQDAISDSSIFYDNKNIPTPTKDNSTSFNFNLNDYIFIPPYEDTKILNKQIKWIHRFPVSNKIYGLIAIGDSLYFLADGNSIIEKLGEKWILKTRLNDKALNHIWGSNKNNIYVAGEENLFHFNGKEWTKVEEWKINNFGYEKRAKTLFGCPNGDILVISAIVIPGIPYRHHEEELRWYDFYKNGKWETIPFSIDRYPNGASNSTILGLDCSENETKILMKYDGHEWNGYKPPPDWMKREDIKVYEFEKFNDIDSAWSDGKGFIAAVFYSEHQDQPLRFYENGIWKEIIRLGSFGLNWIFKLWGINKNDFYAFGDTILYHCTNLKCNKDKVNHLPNMEINYRAGIRGQAFDYIAGNENVGVWGVISSISTPIIFKRNSDGNWWPVYQEYGPYGDEWEWKWMWPSNGKKVFIATSTSIRQFDLGDIPQGKLKLMKVFDFENEKILDAYSINPHQTYLLILDKNQKTFINGHLTPGQKTNKRVYIFNGEKAISKTEIDDKKEKYIKIFAFKDNPDAFLLYGEDSIALYDGKKWTEKKICKRYNNEVLNIWGNSMDDFYIAGSMGCLIRKKQDKWIIIWSGTNKNLTAITGNEKGEIFIARSDGTLFKFKDNRFEQIDLPINKDTYIIKIVVHNDTFYLIYNNGEIGIFENGRFEKEQLFFTRTAYYIEGFGLLLLEEDVGSILGLLDNS